MHYRYNTTETKSLLDSMIILVDSREKSTNVISYFEENGIEYKIKKLNYGDYSFMIPKNEKLGFLRDKYYDRDVMIERKSGLDELSNNLSNERDRFKRELIGAPKDKVLMIENSTYSDLINGNYKTLFNKSSYIASLHKYWFKYDLPFVFIDSKFSGVFVYNYLQNWFKNYLTK